MTNQTETTSAAPKMTEEQRKDMAQRAKAYGRMAVSAFAAEEAAIGRAQLTLMGKVREAADAIGMGLTAAQYDAHFRPAVSRQMTRAVEGGRISEATAAKLTSRLKTATLALLAGFEPNEGEGFNAYCTRASAAFEGEGLKLADGSPVWASKVGRKANADGSKGGKAGGASGAATGSPSGASGGEREVTSGDAFLRACLLTAKGDKKRADALAALMTAPALTARFDRFIAMMSDHGLLEQFDRFAATVQAEREPPRTAMAEALAKAEAKKPKAA